jgi:hypothetical protein
VQGDSGSWVFRGEEAHGVVIAGSTEANGEHYAYAISMTEVCRNISIGMGNASVHVPTTYENAIIAHKVEHQGRDTAALAMLYIKQLVREVAQNGGSPMEIRLFNGVSTSGSFVDSLLVLARICPFTGRSPAESHNMQHDIRLVSDYSPHTQHTVTNIVSHSLCVRVMLAPLTCAAIFIASKRSSIWRGIRKCPELQILETLFGVFASVDRRLDLGQIAQLTQRTMVELGIFPIPNIHQLVLLLRSTKQGRREKERKLHADVEQFEKTKVQLPKILARLFYATSVHQFFVYCGPWAWWLHALFRQRVVMAGTNFSRSRLVGLAADDENHWASRIQAFVIPEDEFDHYSKDVRAHFSAYGDIVEHHELRDLLWRLANSR